MDIKSNKGDLKGQTFLFLLVIATCVGVASLAILVYSVLEDSIGWFDLAFIFNSPSRFPEEAGIYPALIGSIYLMLLVAVFSFPLGVGTAIYLEEYAGQSRIKNIIELNISNLAAVPSIVYGLLGLALFVRALNMGRSLIAGALTLTLLILPIVIVSSQEAIKAVPDSLRDASYGIGATKWQTIRKIVIPEALPGIMTGTILSLSRAIGETAPLIMIGAATSMYSAPDGIFSLFSAMPLQIYAWVGQPQYAFQEGVASAGILLLLIVLLTMNSVAILIRNRFQR
ncbi:phosphate ABC transporter, inner membrane subunit PstA [Methanohalobium evestigatum Z-7303]|uniref:Phosphate transport system permease protein PstA n=1 Tax=Methanohalobium evestigatum (strain ATCC BAA-1072 / DSM 3721 / NBRC 107634 / OCM 161 / Z-7303) TaxID=644295 RepID=D7E5V4_METEZ|nr:phosphate ABC transporter permease PstA [Methanohalobium evestigatum]ADI72976.1 phosphate ABC transporter, inner membrane subunit PstA [Methanohalobium evestigatum Z-7303]